MKQFQVIVADCPFGFRDKLLHSEVARGAEANYKTMTISQIKQLPVKDLADPDGCVLALWVPSSLLQEGLDIMKAWNFQQKTTYIWVKTKKDIIKDLKKSLSEGFTFTKMKGLLCFGMGHSFRASHEICLIGTNNNKIYKQLENRSQRSVSFAPNLKHSSKPENLQDSLDIMFPAGRKLELFARRQRQGWICIGNQTSATLGEDIAVSISKL